MRAEPVLAIAKKELLEIVRDRRTLVLMIGLPVLVYPLMMIGLSRIQQSQSDATEARRSIVALWGTIPGGLDEAFRAEPSIALRPGFGMPSRVARELREGHLAPAPLLRAAGGPRSRAQARPTLRP